MDSERKKTYDLVEGVYLYVSNHGLMLYWFVNVSLK